MNTKNKPLIAVGSILFGIFAVANISFAANIEIKDPYSVERSNNYKGNIHSHTTRSTDGVNTPSEVMSFYDSAGYDFNAITDHEVVTADPGASDILFLLGTEDGQGATGRDHMVKIGPSVTATLFADDQESIDAALAEGDYLQMNHPDGVTDWPLDTVLSTQGPSTVAIWNGVRVREYASQVDAMLASGKRLNLSAEEDLHNVALATSGRSAVHVWADSLFETNIINGLKSGNYYSTYTPAGQIEQVVSVRVVGDQIIVNSNQSSAFVFYGKGTTLQTTSGATSAAYAIVGDEKYVRVRVTGGTAVAWTNPVFIDLVTIRRGAPKEVLLPVAVKNIPMTVSSEQEGVATHDFENVINVSLAIARGSVDSIASNGGATYNVYYGNMEDAIGSAYFDVRATDGNGVAVHDLLKKTTISISGLAFPSNLSALYVSGMNDMGNSWTEIHEAVFDAAAGTVTFQTDHLTRFAVFDRSRYAFKIPPPVQPEQGTVLGSVAYADGTLIRGSDKKIYVLVNGKGVHIRTWAELFAKHRGQEIINVSVGLGHFGV